MRNSDIFKNTVFDHINPFPMLVCSVVAGLLFGVLIDFFSLSERFFGRNRIITFFTDIVSVITTYLFLFVCAYNFNCGIIRWYCVVIAFATFRFYRKTLSLPFLSVCGFLFDTAGKAVSFLIKTLSIPIKKLFDLCVAIYRKFRKISFEVSRKNIYLHEKTRISQMALAGFDLVPSLKEEKKWKRTKRTNRAKK